MKAALILTENQTHFLKENRQDPITGDSFSIGDEIVFCAECKSAFLKESWEYIGENHCNQTKKLKKFPSLEKLVIKKNKFPLQYRNSEIESRLPAIVLDACIAFFTYLLSLDIFGSDSLALHIGFALFIFRDNLFLNRSIGKKMMKLYFIDSKTKRKAIWSKVLARNSIWWAAIVSISILFKFMDTNIVPIILGILVAQLIYMFYLLLNNQSFIDEWLGIELVEKKE